MARGSHAQDESLALSSHQRH